MSLTVCGPSVVYPNLEGEHLVWVPWSHMSSPVNSPPRLSQTPERMNSFMPFISFWNLIFAYMQNSDWFISFFFVSVACDPASLCFLKKQHCHLMCWCECVGTSCCICCSFLATLLFLVNLFSPVYTGASSLLSGTSAVRSSDNRVSESSGFFCRQFLKNKTTTKKQRVNLVIFSNARFHVWTLWCQKTHKSARPGWCWFLSSIHCEVCMCGMACLVERTQCCSNSGGAR